MRHEFSADATFCRNRFVTMSSCRARTEMRFPDSATDRGIEAAIIFISGRYQFREGLAGRKGSDIKVC